MKIFLSLLLLFLSFCKSRSNNEESQVKGFKDGKNNSPTGINLAINSQEFRYCGVALRDCLWTNVDAPNKLTRDQLWENQNSCISRNCGVAFVAEPTKKVCFLEAFKEHLAADLGAFSMWENLCTTNFNAIDPYAPIREWRARIDGLKTAIGNDSIYCSPAGIKKLHEVAKDQAPNAQVNYAPFQKVIEDQPYCQKTAAKSHNYKCPKFTLAMCLMKRFPPDNRLIGGDCINMPPHNKCQWLDPKDIKAPTPKPQG